MKHSTDEPSSSIIYTKLSDCFSITALTRPPTLTGRGGLLLWGALHFFKASKARTLRNFALRRCRTPMHSVGFSRNANLQLQTAKPGPHPQVLRKGSKNSQGNNQPSTAMSVMSRPHLLEGFPPPPLASFSLGHLRKWGNTNFWPTLDPHTCQYPAELPQVRT